MFGNLFTSKFELICTNRECGGSNGKPLKCPSCGNSGFDVTGEAGIDEVIHCRKCRWSWHCDESCPLCGFKEKDSGYGTGVWLQII
jgi:hypothetical protein